MPLILSLLLACGPEPDPCPLWYTDLDGDGFGAGEGVASCEELSGRTLEEGDCEDRDSSVYPGAVDPPLDGVDQDCDGENPCQGARETSSPSWSCEDGPLALTGDYADPSDDPSCVCSVDGDLRLEAVSPAGFVLLESVSGTLWVANPTPWTEERTWDEDLILPALQTLGYLRIEDDWSTVQLPGLIRAERILNNDQIQAFEAPAMRQVTELTLRLSGPQLSLPGLEEAEEVDLQHSNAGLRRVILPSLAQVQTMRVWAGATLQLDAPGEAIAELELRALDAAHVELPDTLKRLQVGPNVETVSGVQRLSRWRSATYGAYYAPDLTSVGELALSFSVLRAPALAEAEHLQLVAATFDAPALEQVATLDTNGSEVSLPRLTHLGRLEGKATLLPVLRSADEVSFQGTLSGLEEVYGMLVGAVIAPELLRVGSLSGPAQESSFPRLRYVDTEVLAYDAAWLPALRHVDGPLVLLDSPSFYAPELITVDWLTLRGDTTAALPDPLPWGLRLEEWAPSAPVQFGALQAGLALVDFDSQAPVFEATSVAGNVEIHAPAWEDVPVTLGPIGGELRYCLSSVAEEDLNAWLAEQDVAGEQVNTCP